MMGEDFQAVFARSTRLADRATLDAALDRMAAEITRDLAGRDPLVLSVLLGGLVPTGWLLSRLDFPLRLDYLHATRYRGGTRGHAEIDWIARPRSSLAGRTVLLVDDILDEGRTLAAIRADCLAQGVEELRIAVLVEKLHDRRVPHLEADYIGLSVEDRYLFGCGMDYHEHGRQHLGVYAVAPEDEGR